MDLDIMGSIFSRLARDMCLGKRKVVFLGDNSVYHPETLQANLTNIKLVFLPKNTALRLQPLDNGIIKNFNHKYR